MKKVKWFEFILLSYKIENNSNLILIKKKIKPRIVDLQD